MKLWGARQLIVGHGVTRSRQSNHDAATLHFDVKIVGGLTLPFSQEAMPTLCSIDEAEKYPHGIRQWFLHAVELIAFGLTN